MQLKIWPLFVRRNATVSCFIPGKEDKIFPKKVLAWSWAAVRGAPGAGDHMPVEVRAASHSWEVCSTTELQFMIQPLALQNVQMCLISLNKCNAICLRCKRRGSQKYLMGCEWDVNDFIPGSLTVGGSPDLLPRSRNSACSFLDVYLVFS